MENADRLYKALAPSLERIVRAHVRAPDSVIEDACQHAWGRLVRNDGGLRHEQAALSWLATTAVREAWRLARSSQLELPLEAVPAIAPDPHDVLERREQLRSLAILPARQQRMLWLQGLGLSYFEMAEHEGCSRRTVERQLLRAKERLRRAA